MPVIPAILGMMVTQWTPLTGKVDFSAGDFVISPFLNYSQNEGDFDGGAFQDADNTYSLDLFNPGVQLRYNRENFRVNGGYNFTRTERAFESQFGVNEFEGRLHNADLFGNYKIGNHLQLMAGLNMCRILTFPERMNSRIEIPGL